MATSNKKGTVVPFNQPYKSTSIKPIKLFLLDQVVQKYGVLDAAITADMYYWIFKAGKPWKVVSDYANWFGVHEKTVRLNINKMADAEFFKMNRTRMRSGSFGANQFSKSNSGSSKVLFELYVSLFNNDFKSSDFGKFDADESDYKEIPRFQLLFLETIKEVEDIKSAYILDRLCWGLNSRGKESLYFRSYSHFARWANMDRKTAERKLELLQQKGLIEYKFGQEQLAISTDESSQHFFRFSEFMEDKNEARKAGIVDGW